jgi:hypothetical protein
VYDLCQALGVEQLRKTRLPKTSVRVNRVDVLRY